MKAQINFRALTITLFIALPYNYLITRQNPA